MKRETEIKYPNSANLFQFCRRVLDHKFGGIRVIDQDVGQILGFDPADCSHWKKGKKNIRSIQAMKSIAEHLGVDERLVVDVASGDVDDLEAFWEYSGYGAFEIDNKILEAAKKEFYRKNAGSWTREKEIEFKTQFDANEALIDEAVKAIHTKINYVEAPLYLPEVVNAYPEIQLVTTAAQPELKKNEAPIQVKKDNGRYIISYPAGSETRPFARYLITRNMADYFLNNKTTNRYDMLGDYSQHVADVQSNMFSAKLLAPASLIRKEIAQINVGKDIVSQLAEIFWVSKGFMNRRLKEVLERNPLV